MVRRNNLSVYSVSIMNYFMKIVKKVNHRKMVLVETNVSDVSPSSEKYAKKQESTESRINSKRKLCGFQYLPVQSEYLILNKLCAKGVMR